MQRTTEERFREKQDRSGSGPLGCWLWRGATNAQGYGQFWDGERRVRAHRFAWESANRRKVPDGLVVAHLCNTKNCTRPSHLQPMRQFDNVHDAIRDELHPNVDPMFERVSARCLAGKEDAWRALHHKTSRVARRFAYHLPWVDPDDLQHDVLCKLLADDRRALRQLAEFRNAELNAFLTDVTRNAVRDAIRRRASRSKQIVEPVTHAEPDAEFLLLVEEVEEKALTSGPKRDRQRNAAIFRAHYRLGMTAQEIGDHLEMNVKSVETILFRLTVGVREACNDTLSTSEAA